MDSPLLVGNVGGACGWSMSIKVIPVGILKGEVDESDTCTIISEECTRDYYSTHFTLFVSVFVDTLCWLALKPWYYFNHVFLPPSSLYILN